MDVSSQWRTLVPSTMLSTASTPIRQLWSWLATCNIHVCDNVCEGEKEGEGEGEGEEGDEATVVWMWC